VTRIDFYTHVSDKISLAVHLTCKAWSQGFPVWLRAPDNATATQLDQLLWNHSKAGFVPHCCSDDDLASETPIVIDAWEKEPLSHGVLINLRSDHPEYFARFERLLEIVSLDTEDSTPARERYHFYRQRGFSLNTHNLSNDRF
jgi:DNA polymerase-3 subunit chi